MESRAKSSRLLPVSVLDLGKTFRVFVLPSDNLGLVELDNVA
jgi:hypothetical protein